MCRGGFCARLVRSGSVLSDGQFTWVDSVHVRIVESTDGEVFITIVGVMLGVGMVGRQQGYFMGVFI